MTSMHVCSGARLHCIGEGNETEINNLNHKSETFPAVSLSVKNPVSSKVLIFMVSLQILSNIGILYFLYLGME